MNKKKKPSRPVRSIRELTASWKSANEEARGYLTQLLAARRENDSLRLELANANQKLRERLDTSMIDSRIKLANALGQTLCSINEAIKFVVAKESL